MRGPIQAVRQEKKAKPSFQHFLFYYNLFIQKLSKTNANETGVAGLFAFFFSLLLAVEHASQLYSCRQTAKPSSCLP